MLEDIIPHAECNIKRLQVSCEKNQNNFSCNREQHKRIINSLSKDRHFSCFASEGVEYLGNDHSIEETALGIFECLCCVADGKVCDG